ncbi:MAG TPA: aldo/keto reductase, partial [Nitrospiria bacterium]|nr:aldo/keto reductase [Nitrospiria bacterium]
EADDRRRLFPRFQGENFQRNLDLVKRIEEIAKRKKVLPSQLALAWLLTRGPDILPIPGTTQIPHLEENIAATEITLSPEEIASIEKIAPSGIASGLRYPEEAMQALNL